MLTKKRVFIESLKLWELQSQLMGFIILIVSGSHTISVSRFLLYYIFGFCFVKLFVLIMAVIESDHGRAMLWKSHCKQRP